ncbi:MAG: DUF4332 domain-containing protein [Deltaproteobacteria bacterium]|nr:DUF4332 domain-containing protein [Deltaproteobacteria bacterium]
MSARYHVDPKRISLDSFHKNLASRELIPSRVMLKERLRERFDAIRSAGVNDLGELTTALKNKPKVETFSKKTGLDVEYLTLLRREANSYFPNPVPLGKFSGIDKDVPQRLEPLGIKNSKQLFERAAGAKDRTALSSESGVPIDRLHELFCLSDLLRLYGVGPVFAKMLYDIGVDAAAAFIRLSPEELVSIYEDRTKKKADFTANDIRFSLEIARELDVALTSEETTQE